MKKVVFAVLIISFSIFTIPKITHADIFSGIFKMLANIQKPFGGRILNTTAVEIQTLEDTGWTCEVPGTSITIKPVRGPASYAIPAGVVSKTNTTPEDGQSIKGLYLGKTVITCKMSCPPVECVTAVTLDTIKMFGTSKN